jgi:chemotaxis signal transduction protein
MTTPSTLESVPSQPQTQNLLNLTLGEQIHAVIPIEQVVEILTLDIQQITPIPDTPTAVAGVFNWRQQVLWLIDLPELLTQVPVVGPRVNLQQLDIIVVRADSLKFGLAVLTTGQLGQIPPDTPERAESSLVVNVQDILNRLSQGK